MMTCSARIRNRQEGEQFAQTYRLPSSIRMQQPSSTPGVTNGFNPDTPPPVVHVSRTSARSRSSSQKVILLRSTSLRRRSPWKALVFLKPH